MMLELHVTITNGVGNIDTPNKEAFTWEGVFDFGDTLEEALNKFGSEVLYDLAKRMITTDIQNGLRGVGRRLADRVAGAAGEEQPVPTTTVELTSAMERWLAGYRPGVQRTAAVKVPTMADIERFIADPSKSREEKAAFLAKMQALLT